MGLSNKLSRRAKLQTRRSRSCWQSCHSGRCPDILVLPQLSSSLRAWPNSTLPCHLSLPVPISLQPMVSTVSKGRLRILQLLISWLKVYIPSSAKSSHLLCIQMVKGKMRTRLLKITWGTIIFLLKSLIWRQPSLKLTGKSAIRWKWFYYWTELFLWSLNTWVNKSRKLTLSTSLPCASPS